MKIFIVFALLMFSVPASALSIEKLTEEDLDNLKIGIDAYNDQNYALAKESLLQIALKGYAKAELLVGVIYLEGFGVKPNRCVGARFIDRAARQGYLRAQVTLSNVLRKSLSGIRPDYKRSYGWLLTAINNGATDPEKSDMGPDNFIQPIKDHLESKLSLDEQNKIRQEVAEGRFDVTTPIDNYVVYLRELHINDYVVKIPPCEEIDLY